MEVCKGGDVRVLVHDTTQQPRLLQRVDETRRVCLNTLLSELCHVQQPSELHVQIHNLDAHSLRLHLFKCKTVSEAQSLRETIQECVAKYRSAVASPSKTTITTATDASATDDTSSTPKDETEREKKDKDNKDDNNSNNETIVKATEEEHNDT